MLSPRGAKRTLDFIPLEIFLDHRCEATDFDRIVMKTDAGFAIDKFNHLRINRQLKWPDCEDEYGRSVTHLKKHQDYITVILPRLQVAATPKHYNSLYNVVTDLLVYTDPARQQRSERIESLTLSLEHRDQDPVKFLLDLFRLQHSVRGLVDLQGGYESNADLLSDEGRKELFKIRTDILEGLEQLFTVFQAVAITQDRDDAREAVKSSSRMEVRVGGLTWHMLREDLSTMLKADVEGTIFSSSSNKDGSTDHAVAFGEICVLNSDADSLYPEVITRYDTSRSYSRKKNPVCFASACWSFLSPVGGINIVSYLAFYIEPVRFQLEERTGHALVDYIFGERTGKQRENQDSSSVHLVQKGESREEAIGSHIDHGKKTKSPSVVHPRRSQSTLGSGSHRQSEDKDEAGRQFSNVITKDASEMRLRAANSVTFLRFKVAATSFIMSYKSDDSIKHSAFSMPDCVDFKIKTPELSYANKVWAWRDAFEHVKRDVKSYVWSQRGDLVSQLFKKTSLFRSKKNLRHLALTASDSTSKRKSTSPSRLRYTVSPPTPSDEESLNGFGSTLAKALSHSGGSPILRAQSQRSSDERAAQLLSTPLNEDPATMSGEDSDDDSSSRDQVTDEPRNGNGLDEHGKAHHPSADHSSEDSHSQKASTKGVKGIFGKIKRHSTIRELGRGRNSGADNSRRGMSVSNGSLTNHSDS